MNVDLHEERLQSDAIGNLEVELKMGFGGSNISIPSLNLRKKSQFQEGVPSLIKKLQFEKIYSHFQVLHIRGFDGVTSDASSLSPVAGETSFHAGDVKSLFESLNVKDKDSWCIENETRNDDQGGASPEEFLDTGNHVHRGYCSFLVQHSKDVMEDLLDNRLPVVDLPIEKEQNIAKDDDCNEQNCASFSTDNFRLRSDVMRVNYGPCLWFFFGKNKEEGNKSQNENSTLQGRPEHTDSVTHDGTWHYQLSGTKIWKLRPTTDLMNRMKMDEQKQNNEDDDGMSSENLAKKRKLITEKKESEDSVSRENYLREKEFIEVECEQGDIIVLNTRLWWHSTMIPPQDVPCISYARDIYFPCSHAENGTTKEGSENDHRTRVHDQSTSMTNVDGTYAAEDIEASTILFTEHTMPDCELHRSKSNPNCQVVELQDESTGESYMAVVSLRDIKAGEFFCILESDNEDGDFEEGGDDFVDCEEEEDDDGLQTEVEDDEDIDG